MYTGTGRPNGRNSNGTAGDFNSRSDSETIRENNPRNDHPRVGKLRKIRESTSL